MRERELALAGMIAAVFGLGSYYATGSFGAFSRVNLALAALVLLAAALAAARRARGFGTAAARSILARHAAAAAAVVVLAVGAERLADRFAPRLDWTAGQRYTLAPATLEALAALPDELVATLYYDPGDPRVRGTRLLLETLARTGELRARSREMDEAQAELDRFGVRTSNSVVLELDQRFALVERPSEGTLWEALLQLAGGDRRRAVYAARGEGEGDLERIDGGGYSGLAAALRTEGYAVRDLVLAAAEAVPEDAAALLLVSPQRRLRDSALELLERYLAAGGRLLVFLDPGVETGLEELLARWGFELPGGLVVDPASGPVEGAPPGVNVIAYAYSDHPAVRGLDANRMTFFPRVRPVLPARKPEPEDRLEAVVFSSPRSWLADEVETVGRGLPPRRHDGTREQRFPLVALGRYPRGSLETRIVLFGDSDLAANRHLRSLYNLDLVMNAVHWVAEREPSITRRPKYLTPDQRPLTPVESLSMFYGVGLLLPELLLIAAAVVWVRRRSA